jgi:spore coat protein SA
VHIAMIAPEQIPIPTRRGGSVEICMYAIASKLADEHRVTIISKQHPGYESVTRSGNLTIIRVPSGSRRRYLASVLKAVKKRRFDWIQVDNRPGYAAAIKKLCPKTPISLFLHSLTFVSPPMTSTDVYLSKVDVIIVNSQSLKKELSRLYPKHRHKIKKVMLGVDLSRFRSPNAEEAASIKNEYQLSDSFNVLFVGRLIPRKGIPVLIKAMSKVRRTLPNSRLLIIGGAQRKDYTALLKQKAKRAGVPTTFLGPIPHHRLHRFYWLGDCFVCPSQEHEAFGLVNVEAMASGVPVIASSIGGIKEVITNGYNGLLVQQIDRPEQFAEVIIKLAQDSVMAESLIQQAKTDVLKKYNWGEAAHGLLKIYSSKLNERKAEKNAKTYAETEWKIYPQQMGQDYRHHDEPESSKLCSDDLSHEQTDAEGDASTV